MEYVKLEDYQYIKNKYNAARWLRQDENFDPSTGKDGQQIKRDILQNDELNAYLPHSIRMAKAFAYVLKNTRIACSPHDKFPSINTVDRPLFATLASRWEGEVHAMMPELSKKRDALEANGTFTYWPDYSHSVPVWERIFSLGFYGLLQESEKTRTMQPRTDEETAFFDSIKIAYEAIIEFIGRLVKQAEEDSSPRLAENLAAIQYAPPKTFYQALLVDYLYFMICEHINGMQVRSLSNFDKMFYPFYRSGIENGVSEEEMRSDLAYFFLQFTAINNYFNQPVFLGGCKENEETVINEFSYVFLDVYDKMGIFNPKIQIKVAKSTPKDFLLKALDMIRRGNNSIVFVNDAILRESLMRLGVSAKEARECDVKGCYEHNVQGGIGSEMNYLNLLKPLEYVFYDGCDALTGERFGLPMPLENLFTFEDFYEAYKKQLCHLIDQCMEISNAYDEYLDWIHPQPMLSATIPNCLQSGKDALGGGALNYLAVLGCGFIADLADSLVAVKKYVYDKKALSLSEFKEMLDNNYEGNEKFRLRLFNDPDKFGNDKDLPDSLAVDISKFVNEYVSAKATNPKRGGHWTITFHSARRCYEDGALTAATPNGRKKGEELSKNVSAAMGQNREGATAAILTATKFDAAAYVGDTALDLGLLPSAVQGDDGLEAMYGLLTTFVERGGHALQINVFSADTLREAQKHPEKYQDLQIRVCGWNVLWNNINKTEQEGFIRQAESLI